MVQHPIRLREGDVARRPARRSGVTVIAVGVACMVASAVGTGGAGASTHARTITKSQLRAKLLRPSQFPAGWSTYTAPKTKSKTKAGGCLADIKHPHVGQGSNEVSGSYTDNESQILTENLQSGALATDAFKQAAHLLKGCKSVSVVAAGKTVRSRVTKLAFPALARSTRSYAMSFTAQGQTLGVDLIIFKQGEFGGDFVLEAPGTPSITELSGFIRTALSDLTTVSGAPSKTA